MNVRFVIRKQALSDGQWWIIRDGACHRVESHDFDSPRWTLDCGGACDTTKYFSSAIGTVAATMKMEGWAK